jgi:hypothetical protein
MKQGNIDSRSQNSQSRIAIDLNASGRRRRQAAARPL